MSGAGPLPYLGFNSVEVANAARTLTYLSNGLGDTMQGHWEIRPGDLCDVLYRLEGTSCIPSVFVSPSADPAPWYDAGEEGADTFLGLVMLGIRGYDSTRTRVVSEKVQGLGGASFSGERRGPREWTFRAAMVSADDLGAEYGLRWLTSVLGASACDNCETGELVVRLSCPPSDCSDDTIGEWLAYDTVLTLGPKEVEQWSPRPGTMDDSMGGCRDLVVVEWTMVSGNPYLYKRPELCLSAETLGAFASCDDICEFLFGWEGDPHCCSAPTRAKGETIAPIFTFESISGMGNIVVGSYEVCPTGTDEGSPVALLEIDGVPQGGTVVVDCARREITLTYPDPDTGETITGPGEGLIVLPEDTGIQWPEATDCDDVTCFCARTAHPCSQGGDTTVEIDLQLRVG